MEVQCRVGAGGPVPLSLEAIPKHPRELMMRVKAYERATVTAALSGNRDELVAALALNPLVSSRDHAGRLVNALLPS